MYIFNSGLCGHNLNHVLKHLKNVNNSCLYLPRKTVVRNINKMSQKISQSKTYIAVTIPENGQVPAGRNRFWSSLFRRNVNTQNPKIVKVNSKPEVNAKLDGTQTRNSLKKSELRRLFGLAKPEKWRLIGAIGFLMVSSSVTMAIPFSLGKVLDIIFTSEPDISQATAKLNKVCGILIGVFVLGAVCNFGRVYLMSVSGYRMTQSLRTKVFSNILKQEQGWFDKRPTGELVNRLSSDTQIVGQALSSNISDGLRSTVMVIAGSTMMFYMSPKLAALGLLIVIPVAAGAVGYGRFVRGITRQVQDSLADATKVAEEKISNVRTVKSFARETQESNRYKSAISNVLHLCYREAKYRAFFYGMTGFSGNLIIISVMYYGGMQVSNNVMTVGHLTSFILYAAYIGISLSGLSSFYTELNKSVGAASRIWEIIDREPLIPAKGGLIPINPPNGHITFNKVSFSYPSREEVLIFKNLELEISPGCMVAVVGPSGSGKSTLAALLLRLYDPNTGNVILDTYDIKELDPCWLKQHIGTVSQEPILFSCSIRDNILYGAENPETVTDEQLERVSKEANVYEFVKQLPDGYNTLVGERGVMLSGGQKQRVAIARALIKDPKILLLDEATSALDAQSERLVQEALERVMKGRTVLTIAHRLSTIKNADVIAVLKNGEIMESGNYADLMCKENGIFRELVQHQTFHDISMSLPDVSKATSVTDIVQSAKEECA